MGSAVANYVTNLTFPGQISHLVGKVHVPGNQMVFEFEKSRVHSTPISHGQVQNAGFMTWTQRYFGLQLYNYIVSINDQQTSGWKLAVRISVLFEIRQFIL